MRSIPTIARVVWTAASIAVISLANPTLSFAENADLGYVQAGLSNLKYFHNLFSIKANRKSGNPVTMFITPDSIAEVRTIDKSGNPETVFIGPNSMAEVPTSSSSLRAAEQNRSQD